MLRKRSLFFAGAILAVVLASYLMFGGCFQLQGGPPTQVVPSTPTALPSPAQTIPPGAETSRAAPTAAPTQMLPSPSPVAVQTQEVATPTPVETPTPQCRHDKMESGLSALVYTREHAKESPPAKGSEIDVLLSKPDIRIAVTFTHPLDDEEIAQLEAKGIIFDRLRDGKIAGLRLSTGNLAGKWSIGVVIPWDILCWFSDQDYVYHLTK